MPKRGKGTYFDLENRTAEFAKKTRSLIRIFSYDWINRENAKQLIRSSGSVGPTILKQMRP